MTRHRATTAILIALAAGAALAQDIRPGADACARLQQLSLPGVSILSATAVDGGPFMAPDPSKIGPWYTNGIHAMIGGDAPVVVPPFCRVTATARPSPSSNVGIEVWLPRASAWNGKLLGTGNGGSGGTIAYPMLAAGIDRGYATANTDLGTGAPNVSDISFGIGRPDLVADYAYRATHAMTTAAREIVNAYYARPPRVAYFSGCSTGGHQGLVEARRYPDDYDGIVAGAPDTSAEGMFAGLWQYAATHGDPASYFPASKLPLIARAVMAQCDALDGVTDGVIEDPRRCRFDPSSLECRSGDAADCFIAPQVAALKKIYEGIRDTRTGKIVYPGMEPGSEGGPLGLESILAMPPAPGAKAPVGYARWTRAWKGPGFDWDADFHAVVDELRPELSADPDLHVFGRRGKLLMYSGWSDPIEAPRGIIDYFESVRRTSSGAPFARLFMVPGMSHCAGGSNVSYFDSLGAIERWVEGNEPPDRIVAARIVNGVVTRTRPVCAYPKVARWTGQGSTDRAENFRCVAPE